MEHAAAAMVSDAFVAPAVKATPPVVLGAAPRQHGAATAAGASSASAAAWGVGLAAALGSARKLRRAKRKGSTKVAAVPPLEPQVAQDFLSQIQEFCQQVNLATGDTATIPAEVAASLQHWADSVAQNVGHLAQEIVPPAYAADLPPVELDPNTTYLYGADGNVLVDPMNNKPLADDWWNGFVGFQKEIIKSIDAMLRENGVEQAFGWTIVLYTALIKVLFFPLQQGQLKSTSMMQLLQPKVKEIQEKYENDPETQQRLLGQLYSVMDVNPLGGCLPVLLQLPIFWSCTAWSLYGVWRRLAAEKYPYFTEGWLWVPSLAQPNPDFQFKRFDWLLQWKDGAPEMGWHDYLSYLVPALNVVRLARWKLICHVPP
eukprot:Skav227105  [mRNA]  locus=scaffold199:233538:241840:+ [translate_table: standard]